MQALRQPGMRERHWQQLSEQLGMTLKPDKEFVLSKALDMHLMEHLDTIQKVPFLHACQHTSAFTTAVCCRFANLLQPQPFTAVHAVPSEACRELVLNLLNSTPCYANRLMTTPQVLRMSFKLTGQTVVFSLQVLSSPL